MITLALVVTACGSDATAARSDSKNEQPDSTGTVSLEDAEYPFASVAAGPLLLVVRAPYDSGPSTRIAPDLVDSVAAVEGVTTAVGSAVTLSLEIADQDGHQLDLPGGGGFGATWVPGDRQYFGAEIVAGDAPGPNEFVIDEISAGQAGMQVGAVYALRGEGAVTPATLSGLTTYSAKNGVAEALVDSATALSAFTDTGKFRQIFIEIESGDASATLESVRALLPGGLELASPQSSSLHPADQQLVTAICSYLDDGGNDLVDVLDLARVTDGDDRFNRAYNAAMMLQATCPAYVVDEAARDLLRGIAERMMLTENPKPSDAGTAELFMFWEDVCSAADEGRLVEDDPSGLSIDWDDPSSNTDAALFGFVELCPDSMDKIRELVGNR